MKWLLAGLFLISIQVHAVPDEILSEYLDRYEMCVKDARIRAPSAPAFSLMKQKCKEDYSRMIEGGLYSRVVVTDNSMPIKIWKKFVDSLFNSTYPRFKIEGDRKYFYIKNRAVLSDFYITRDVNFPNRFVLWKKGMKVKYKTIPVTKTLYNAKLIDGKIIVTGMDSDLPYTIIQHGTSYYMETEAGHILQLSASVYLADCVLILYDDMPIGTITRKETQEID